LSYILGNPFYIGKVRWNRRESNSGRVLKPETEWIISDAAHEPIISPDIYERAQQRTKELQATHKKYAHPISHGKHWLSGMLKCSVCGSSLTVKHNKASNTVNFQCTGYRNGTHKESQSISANKVQRYILESLEATLASNNFAYEVIDTGVNYENNALIFWQNELKKISLREERARAAYMDGIDSAEEYKENKKFIADKKTEVEKQIAELKLKQTPEDEIHKKMRDNISNAIEIINDPDADNTKKANAIRSIAKKIVFVKKSQSLVIHYFIAV